MRMNVALSAGVSMLALASTVLAQGVSEPSGADTPKTDIALEEVVVTGSRAIRNSSDAPTPLTVATTEQLQLTPSGIPDALNKLPQFSGSTTSVGSGNGAGSGRSNIFTGNFMNLRSFGAIRTLVLMDGRRVPPTAINGQVDTNTLPQMLVRNVDIVTGGVSAVYGSDAVTGVVNFVLDKELTGIKTSLQGGTSERGDAKSWRAGAAGGFDLFERGHVIWSAEHYDNDGIRSAADRTYSRSVPTVTGGGTAASPYVIVENARISNVASGGLATSGPFNGQQFVGAGVLAPFNSGTPTATAGTAVGGDGAYFTRTTLVPSVETNQAFGRFEYPLSDNMSAYVQGNFGESSTDDLHNLAGAQTSFRIYSGNPYLPADAQTALNGTPATAFFSMGRLLNDLAADASLEQTTRSFSGTAGVIGKLFDNYTWDIYYNQGESRVYSVSNNNINYPRLFAALDAVRDASGSIVCNVSVTNPGLYPGCAPIDLLGSGNESAAAKAYVFGDTSWVATNKMKDVAGHISGEPFSTWAGPAALSFNFEYRDMELVETVDANSLAPLSLTGIRANSATLPTTTWAYATETNTRGTGSVWEVGSEVLLPLLEDARLAKRLAVNGAIRYTEYSTSGAVNTWKLGAIYQPIDQLRFRFSSSRDIRAPSLADLYASTNTSFTRIADPHTGVSNAVAIQRSGNPNLVPEVARTYTAGLLYEPTWLPQFALSVDYFQTRISNAIGTIGGSDPAVLAECERTVWASPVCVTIQRPLGYSNTTAANFPTLLYTQTLNIASAYTRGFDVEASYRLRLADVIGAVPGDLNLRLLYAYQPVLLTQTFPSSLVVDAAGAAGLASSRITGVLGYRNGPISSNIQVRYLSGEKRSGNPADYYADPRMPSIAYTDFDLVCDFDFARDYRLQAFVNIGNVFDRQPRISPAALRATIPGTGSPVIAGDDAVGRYYTVGFRLRH